MLCCMADYSTDTYKGQRMQAYNPQTPPYRYPASTMAIGRTTYGMHDFQQYLQRPSASTMEMQQLKKAQKEEIYVRYERNMQKIDDANYTRGKLTRELSDCARKQRVKEGELLSCVKDLQNVTAQYKRLLQDKKRLTHT